MRPLLFFLLLVPVFVGAQSARKINNRLKNEYRVVKSEYDSVYAGYYHNRSLLGGVTFKTLRMLQEELPSRYAYFEAAKKKVKKSAEDLQKVGLLNFPDFSLERIDTLKPDYNRMAEAFKAIEPKKEVSEISIEKKDFAFPSEDEPVRSRNAMLEKLLPEIRAEISLILRVNAQVDGMSTEFKKVNELVESWVAEINEMTAFVESYGAPVVAKREEIKNEVGANPEAYSKIYAEVFSDAFLKEQERFQRVSSEDTRVEERKNDGRIELVCDVPAEFPGGMSALSAYLSENLVIPASVTEKRIAGKCYLRFVVSESGEISNIQVMKGVRDCAECDMAAVRVVKSMPKWIPGQNNGKSVSSYFNLPIKFE